MIRVWQQYSCNNSGSYRIVARFADAARARAIRDELAGLLASFSTDHHDVGFQALAELYGFDWRDGGYGGPEDGPTVVVDETTLIVHHDYCLGIGPGVPAYLQEQGAIVERENWADVYVTLLFRPPPPDPRLEDELAALFGHAVTAEHRTVEGFISPWVNHHTTGTVAWYRDAGIVAMYFPVDPRDLVHLRAWLADRSIEPILRIDAFDDEQLVRTLAAATCTACRGPLEYLDPLLHDIETPQLVCKPCGGLYDLAAFR